MRRFALAVAAVALLAGPAWGGPTSLDVEWAAPTTSADGTPLTDLAGYRVYIAASGPPCPSLSYVAVASPTTAPGPATIVRTTIPDLTPSTTYHVQVTALDTSGNESACTPVVSKATDPGLPPGNVTNVVLRLGPEPPAPAFAASPATVTFGHQVGQPLPPAQTVTISGGSGTWTTEDTNPWADVEGGVYNPALGVMEFAATATGFTIRPSGGMLSLGPGVHEQPVTIRRVALATTVTVRVVVQ